MQSWSNLPDDTINLIVNRAVCKSWRSAASIVKYEDKLPWLMAYNSSSCFLYSPYHQQQYTVFRDAQTLADAHVLDSRYGWVLLSKKTETASSLFFYTPFTNHPIIQLPELKLIQQFPPDDDRIIQQLTELKRFYMIYLFQELDLNCCCHAATFTATPLSPECLIFVLKTYTNSRAVRISICKPHDTKWTEYWFLYSPRGSLQNVEYLDGVFYCCFYDSDLCTFNLALKEWKIPRHVPRRNGFLAREHVIKSDGELLVVQFSEYSQWRIFRVDRPEMKCFQVKSWNNRSLFMGLVSMSIPVEEASELANTIHYQYKQKSCPISKPLCPQISQIYDWHVDTELKFWIQPPPPQSRG